MSIPVVKPKYLDVTSPTLPKSTKSSAGDSELKQPIFTQNEEKTSTTITAPEPEIRQAQQPEQNIEFDPPSGTGQSYGPYLPGQEPEDFETGDPSNITNVSDELLDNLGVQGAGNNMADEQTEFSRAEEELQKRAGFTDEDPALDPSTKVTTTKLTDEQKTKGEITKPSDLDVDEGAVVGDTASMEGLEVGAPGAIDTKTYEAAKTERPEDMVGARGEVSDEALTKAVTVDPTQTAITGLEAAQIEDGVQIAGPAVRGLEAGELVTGATVSMGEVEQNLAKLEAQVGQVTREQTVQGQLEGLMNQFEEGRPPPAWAAGAMRNAQAMLNARGISASSMAGQAIVQAAMESAIPIAAQDAQTFSQMARQNLANRQQTALFAAEQRARFLGQKFDQEFQTKVINAAKISEIANMNFTAEQQVVLENARLAQTTQLANLSNEQALVMATAAQIAALEGQNLTNRQMAEVENAKAFLQMDMQNLSNEQQASVINYQGMMQAALSDQAAENAAAQFNAESQNQVDMFMAELSTQVKTANANRSASMRQFNVDQINSVRQFNATMKDSRQRFNSEMQFQVNQSNALWRREVYTQENQMENENNRFNAQNLLNMTQNAQNNLWQAYRDEASYIFQGQQNEYSRAHAFAMLAVQIAADKDMFDLQADYESGTTLTEAIIKGLIGSIDEE